MWTFPSLESIGQDLPYAVRGLRQQRGFTATVVFVLASVIGLNTTLFTVLAGVALDRGRASPIRHASFAFTSPTRVATTPALSLADARSLQQQRLRCRASRR